MNDALGDRIKGSYENRTRYLLPRRTYTVIRVDGKAFHTLTRGCGRPFDQRFIRAMDGVAKALCEGIQGARLAFVQSDEASVILSDFETPTTDAWFDGNVQKIASISASMATVAFNDHLPGSRALFDSRVFTIPDRGEVLNYLVWRQQDAIRNSIQMVAQCSFSAEHIHGKSVRELQEMLLTEQCINWHSYPEGCKRGRVVVLRTFEKDVEYTDKRSGETRQAAGVKRRAWCVEDAPLFTQERTWADAWLPRLDGSTAICDAY